MAYKHVIKVNDVCQIVDKSQLITKQRNTVSLTNNGDGSISLTGAATNYEWVPITQISNRKIIKHHVYLLGGNSYKNSLVAMYGRCILSTGNRDFGYFSYNNEWVRFISNYTGYFQIMLQMRDVILDNFKITPQFFDLTDMYGSGNEPATVAEFREKFPNDYYPYTPYNYLQSNKRMIKVSDVCQLLDKSKYPATHTRLGCTFTNNGDGSFTINGTIQKGGSWSNSLQQITQNLYGHKILFVTKSTSDIVRGEMKFTLQNGSSKWGTYNSIYTVIYDDYKYISIRIYMDNVDTGKTIDNATVKFQLFDLTEMFGAGHEPATVAEFRQRFPNEYYPYSPQCWLTSYKSAVVCKTKNLFDVNNAVPYTFTNDNPPSSRISLKDGIYTTTFNNYNVGSGLRIKDGLVLSPGTYTLSLSVITVGETTPITSLTYGFRLYKSDGTKPVIVIHTTAFSSRSSHAFTIPSDCTDIRLYLAPHCDSAQDYVYISLKDIQIEQGSTATSYVPYQHL